ncbi:MAG: hypothetical protein P1P84_11440 [Deferrisomatales bacterium]|nr:hypothetical protein [Deferrisomatales bacterium]
MALGMPRLTLKRKLVLTLALTTLGAAGLGVLAVAAVGRLGVTTVEVQNLSGIRSTLGEARTMCLEMELGYREGNPELRDRILPALRSAQEHVSDPTTRETTGLSIGTAARCAEGKTALEEVRATAAEADARLLAGETDAHGKVDGAVLGAGVATATGAALVPFLAACLLWVGGRHAAHRPGGNPAPGLGLR